jgi:hypothetical protein
LRMPTPRRPQQQHVVGAGGGDLQGAAGDGLAGDVGEVEVDAGGAVGARSGTSPLRCRRTEARSGASGDAMRGWCVLGGRRGCGRVGGRGGLVRPGCSWEGPGRRRRVVGGGSASVGRPRSGAPGRRLASRRARAVRRVRR